jgi:N-acetylmuramoyl-L-alanine amidase
MIDRKWSGIVVHHSLTRDGAVADWDAIREYHIKNNRWQDIGYHFGIEYVNGKIIYRLGRNLDINGAHTKGFNDTHLGICLVGNYDLYHPENDKMTALTDLCVFLMKFFDIKLENIIGHRESYVMLGVPIEKSCPGKMFDMECLRCKIRDKLSC